MKKFLVVSALLVGLGVAGFWFGLPGYRHWKQDHLLTQARVFLQETNIRSAFLSARQALAMDQTSVEACRIMAQVTEAVGSPASLQWRQRVVELEPRSLSNRLDLARGAVLQGNYLLAAQTLQGVDKTNQANAAFHQMAGMIAVGLNNIPAADSHFTEAAKLEPEDKLAKLNQAVIHLQARDRQIVAGALRTLEQLYTDPVYHRDALLNLALAALHNKDYAKAEAFTTELQADPKAALGDKLLHLEVLKTADRPGFDTYLSEMESTCAKEPEQANTLTAWLLAHDLAGEATRWLASLPADLQNQRAVKLARADSYLAQNSWTNLQTMLQDANWDDLEFLRLSMLSRAYREQGQDFASQNAWLGAVKAASERAGSLNVLARMANKWGWDKEREEVLWLIVQRFPAERWALQTLNQLYLSNADTLGLQKVYSTLLRYDPADAAAENNLASVLLLLNIQTGKAHEMARDAYTKTPGNPAFASTHAYSLHLQGRTKEGLKVLETLTPSQLENPAVAIYYGLLLLGDEQPARAKKYLELAETGRQLPEEKALLDAAKRGL